MALSELINAQWDDAIALTLALFIIPFHMLWCLGHPSDNLRHRKLARAMAGASSLDTPQALPVAAKCSTSSSSCSFSSRCTPPRPPRTCAGLRVARVLPLNGQVARGVHRPEAPRVNAPTRIGGVRSFGSVGGEVSV